MTTKREYFDIYKGDFYNKQPEKEKNEAIPRRIKS